jgi:NitT/TauT family transport system permease protein
MDIKKTLQSLKKDGENLFKMGYDGPISSSTRSFVQIVGWVMVFIIWWGLSMVVSERILPNPLDVFKSFVPLYTDKHLIYNMFYSIGVNLGGYVLAVVLAIPVGFLMGLIPIFKHSMAKPVDSARFVPIPVTTGIFVGLFGLSVWLKINFLAFGIFVYLLPVVVQRIEEVDSTLKQTIWTLGANKWQRIRRVYIPSVLSRISDDIRVLVAISWTYIVVAEMMNQVGGLGNLATIARQETRYDMLYAIILLILLIGFLQDKLFKAIDKGAFRYKYV